MKKLLLGHSGKRSVSIDIDILLRTRMLVQAGSGGGKSWVLRRLAEQLFGKVPVFIIDPEGEFATLREKFGYVLVGKGGETPADPRSAEVVAKKLLELRASAVCDIYELKPQARHHWVRLFLEALIDAPKSLWHQRVVIVDEAHMLAPERGQGESEAYGAMIDLATRGRKRGLAAVFATQRLGKLSKNASAELLNRLVGPTFEDIDLDRAADLLSILRADRGAFFKEMKVLEPGNFYAFGRAVSNERILVEIGDVKTTHPEMGSSSYSSKPPPPPEKIKALLPKLADLPKEAEEKARTEADLKTEIRSLKAQLAADRISKTPMIRSKTEIKRVPVVLEADLKRMEKVAVKIEVVMERASKAIGKIDLLGASKNIRQAIAEAKGLVQSPVATPPRPSAAPIVQRKIVAVGPSLNGDEKPLMAGERRMLETLARFYPGTRTRSQIGQLTGLSPRGGTFGNYFGRLKRDGYITEAHDGSVLITEKGMSDFDGKIPEGPSGPEELLQMWRGKLIAGERKMLDALIEAFPEVLSREELGEKTGFTHTGGTFGNYLGTLRRNDLITVEGDSVRASETLCEVASAR